MIYSYEDVISKYKNNYQLDKALKGKKIFRIESGIYSSQEFVNYLLIINKKYPNAVFTFDSAFYYHNLTDVIPQNYFLATNRKASKIMDNKVKQIYVPEDKFDIGITTIMVDGIKIKIYDKEKLLIELVKNSKNIPFDYYKEIINNYRSISDKLDINKLSDYLNYYKNDIDLFLKIQKEVF
jgi:predicted transcriptional regulator of viral defense system